MAKKMTHALQEKYRLMLAMRLEREELERQGIMKFSGSAAQQRKKSPDNLPVDFLVSSKSWTALMPSP